MAAPFHRATRTKDSLARLTAAWTTLDKFTKEKRAAAKHRAEVGRQMRLEPAELEAWSIERGHFRKKWRKYWDKL